MYGVSAYVNAGKTKVAKLFAKYLNEIELVKRGCVQITARVLLNGNRHFIVDQQIKHVMYHHGGVSLVRQSPHFFHTNIDVGADY